MFLQRNPYHLEISVQVFMAKIMWHLEFASIQWYGGKEK